MAIADSLSWSRYGWRLVRWTHIEGVPLSDPDAETLAQLLSAHIVEHRLEGADQLRDAWIRVHVGGDPYSALERTALHAFLTVVGPRVLPDHAQGTVAEYLWHAVSIEDDDEPELVRIRGPKFYATAPGGDGLTVRRDGGLIVTLWEIKKHTGSHLTSTIRDAYGQLSAHGARYLAEHASAGQLATDPEEARVFARLVESWIEGEEHMHAGVAVATPRNPKKCFSTMQNHFGHLRGRDPCRGLLISLEHFPAFTRRVGEIIWTGL